MSKLEFRTREKRGSVQEFTRQMQFIQGGGLAVEVSINGLAVAGCGPGPHAWLRKKASFVIFIIGDTSAFPSFTLPATYNSNTQASPSLRAVMVMLPRNMSAGIREQFKLKRQRH